MIKIVILAAGKGRRMKNELPKVLIPIKGKPIIEYLVKSVIKSGVDKNPIIIVSPDNKTLIKHALDKYNCRYAIQEKQLGTGHAVMCAKDVIGGKTDHIICFYGDHPLVRTETIKKLASYHNGTITITTTMVKDFEGWRKSFYHWGRIIRNNGQVREIVEFKDASEEIRKTKEVNPAFYCFNAQWLWQNIDKLDNKNVQEEYYLTDLIKIAFEQDIKVNSFLIDPKEAVGINTNEELAVAKEFI